MRIGLGVRGGIAALLGLLLSTGLEATTLTTVFSFDNAAGVAPAGRLLVGPDGNLYGTTSTSSVGTGNHIYHGTVFKLTADGKLTVLHTFSGGDDGDVPNCGLFLANDGNFYGATSRGGSHSLGTVFRISPTGTFSVIHNFAGGANDGETPSGAVMQASDGFLYGTTEAGGSNNLGSEGTVYRLKLDGSSFSVLHAFNYQSGQPDGRSPEAGLVEGTDGALYGTTQRGGETNNGTVFRITKQGSCTTLHSFAGGDDGEQPQCELVKAADGNFYGVTSGSFNASTDGNVFRISQAGSYKVIHTFTGRPEGSTPVGGLIVGKDGALYGTTTLGGVFNVGYGYGTVFKVVPGNNVVLTTLYNFGGGDGNDPVAPLVQTSDGEIYGTTLTGGTYTHGTVFRVDLSEELPAVVTLHSFASNEGTGPRAPLLEATDGYLYGTTYDQGSVYRVSLAGAFKTMANIDGSAAALVQANDGNFYGTTEFGGDELRGNVFSMTPSGTITTLHTFITESADGDEFPRAPLVEASDGNLYGTTETAVTSDSAVGCVGSIFRITLGGNYARIVRFGQTDTSGNGVPGKHPYGGVIQGKDGNLYGTTREGGPGGGSFFKTSLNGPNVTELHTFVEGNFPESSPILGSDGQFYVTLTNNGLNQGGTVVKLTAAGTSTLLHSFGGGDGETPKGSLLLASDGYYYGTTAAGGEYNYGTIFRLTSDGVFTRLHSFNGSDGNQPLAALIQAGDGNLYGTTYHGGANSRGTVFKLVLRVAVLQPLKITSIQRNSSGTQLRFPTVAGHNYRVDFKNSLTQSSWSILVSSVPGSDGTVTIRDTNPGMVRFYRVVQL